MAQAKAAQADKDQDGSACREKSQRAFAGALNGAFGCLQGASPVSGLPGRLSRAMQTGIVCMG
jgi:hypothetical protein